MGSCHEYSIPDFLRTYFNMFVLFSGEPKKKNKLPPRPADYDHYWYEDDDGNWRNEYDDEGYEFAEPETDKEVLPSSEIALVSIRMFFIQK